MNRLSSARTRLDSTPDLPSALDAAYCAFEAILAVLRHHQERSGPAFPAFVLAAGAAASGRDWITRAPSLPPAAPGQDEPLAGDGLLTDRAPDQVAAAAGELAHELATRLSVMAGHADQRDGTACLQAARYAARITVLLDQTGRT